MIVGNLLASPNLTQFVTYLQESLSEVGAEIRHRIADVGDIANLLLQKRGARRVGKNWADRFVARRPELKTRLNRVYDYQRGFCEDPAVIEPWFRLVANMRAKYGILDCDFYNFDETGFMMSMIRPGMVVTHSDRVGKPKELHQPVYLRHSE